MVPTAKRELVHAQDQWSITQFCAALTNALAGSGPALGIGNILSTSVSTDVALVVTTSGSTGTPKEIHLSAAAVTASAKAANTFLKADAGNSWSLLLPLTHIAGINVLVRALLLKSEVLDFRNNSQYTKADFTAIVPTQLNRALTADHQLLKHLQEAKAVLVGGAPLAESDKQSAHANGINVITTYGMSETSGGCIYDGVALDGVAFEIASDGRIKIAGPVLADIEKENGWFITQDLGKIVDGKLQVIGRADDVIISGGENISLSAIEAEIHRKFPNLLVAAFSTPDSKWGQALHIAVQSKDEKIKSELSDVLVESIGAHAKPKSVLLLDKLPQIGIGKIDRISLAKLVSE